MARISPATQGVPAPDNAPVDYASSSFERQPVVVLLGDESGTEFAPVTGVDWSSITLGRDGEPTTAHIEPKFTADDLGAAGTLGQRHLYHLLEAFDPNLLVRIVQLGADGEGLDDFPLFEGWPELHDLRSDPRNKQMAIDLTGKADWALHHDPRAQITGQIMRANRAAAWSRQDPDLVSVEALPVVFNAGGRPNRSRDYFDMRPWAGPLEAQYWAATPRIPVFTDPLDKQARFWSLCDALRYLLHFHLPLFINANDFWYDVATWFDLWDVPSPDPFVAALTRRLPETPAASTDLAEALKAICEPAGVHYNCPLANVAGTWVHWLRFCATGTYGPVPDRRMPQPADLDLPRDPPFSPAAGRTPHDRLTDNAAQTISFVLDHRVVNNPIVLGGEPRHEVTLLLIPGWLPFGTDDAQAKYRYYYNTDAGLGPLLDRLAGAAPTVPVLDNVDLDDEDAVTAAMDWWATLRAGSAESWTAHACLQFHSGHPQHRPVDDVGRKWVLAEHCAYAEPWRRADGEPLTTHSPYHRSYYASYAGRGAYPWDQPYDFCLTGIAAAASWAHRPRPLLNPIARDADGNQRKPRVEIRAGWAGWEELTEFELLTDEAGIRITAPNLTQVATAVEGTEVEPFDLIAAIINQTLAVRVTCTVEGDGRLKDDTYTPGRLNRRSAQIFDHRPSFRSENRRDQNSIFNDEPKADRYPYLGDDPLLLGEGQDDSAAIARCGDHYARRLNRVALSGSPEIPWLDYTARLGDEVDSCTGLGLNFMDGAEVMGIEYLNESGAPRTRWLLNDTRQEAGA